MEKLVTIKEYDIHYYEIDYSRKVLITSIINFFSDMATQQAEDIGLGFEWLEENNLAWVIYKWDINMIKYPRYNEKIIVKTWPYSLRKFYAYKKYEILDLEGNVLCTADSLWFLINTNKRKPARITEKIYNGFKISMDCDDKVDFEKISDPETIHAGKSFDVRYSDIDTNRHVNNVKYIDWCIETVPLDVVLKYSLRNIKVVYEKETSYGDTINVATEILRDEKIVTCIHKIEDREGKKLTLVKTIWEKD